MWNKRAGYDWDWGKHAVFLLVSLTASICTVHVCDRRPLNIRESKEVSINIGLLQLGLFGVMTPQKPRKIIVNCPRRK